MRSQVCSGVRALLILVATTACGHRAASSMAPRDPWDVRDVAVSNEEAAGDDVMIVRMYDVRDVVIPIANFPGTICPLVPNGGPTNPTSPLR